jgi:hypothetical protein
LPETDLGRIHPGVRRVQPRQADEKIGRFDKDLAWQGHDNPLAEIGDTFTSTT